MASEVALLGGTPVRTEPFPQWPVWDEREEQAVLLTLRSGKWGKIDGEEVRTFEQQFAEYHGAKFGIGVCNGTISLKIALMAAGIEAGDEVIVPPYTFLATATAVIEANATPIFVDIDRETFNLDPSQIELAITPRTLAIIPVHLGGLPCDIDAIMTIARKHNLVVIEDAAHAHGSEYKGRRVGGIGHMGSFSFQSSKNLSSGEGGIILTNDDALAQRCRSIHNCGRIPGGAWYEHHVIAGNYRLGELQGALLNAQMERLDEQTNRRDENGKYLDAKLKRLPGIMPQRRTADCTRNAYHLYCYRYDANIFGMPRKRFVEAMNREGIPVAEGYVLPLYRQPLFANKAFGPYTGSITARPDLDYGKLRLPNAEAICGGEGGWIYQSVLLGTQRDMDDVVRGFEKVYEHRHELAEQHEPAMAK
ncbi:MAG TPA: DegT/DnrJ/EryC1/StrS family aminotransferase [Tepidisphaeraceae bacterium]|jgi:dTDP-4-amino-4,6-dideoxygalactose transaminase